MKSPSKQITEEIELMRGGEVVSTLTGSFGQAPRETRLTAILGYLIALSPQPFVDLFGFRGLAQRVWLETPHDQGRSDILIKTSLGTGIIEAKVDATDPLEQARRYPANWIGLLTHHVPVKEKIARGRYVTWQQLAQELEKLEKCGSQKARIISRDLLDYMKAHQMTKERKSFEIYAREINEPLTLEMFLKAQIYGCKYDARSRLVEALYFAPHFGANIAKLHPDVNVGISYISHIDAISTAANWKEFSKLANDQRGSFWWNRHKDVLRKQLQQRWKWPKDQRRSFLFLGQPHLVFNPPVRKENLQTGRGWLSKRFFSFEEFFAAWVEK